MSRFLIHILGILLLATSIQAQDSTVQQKELWYEPLTISPQSPSSQSNSGICGDPLHAPIEVLVTDKRGRAVPGIQVAFHIIAQPEQGEGALLDPQLVLTDSTDLAQTEMIVRTMFSLIRLPFLEKDASRLGDVYIHEQEVNFLSDSIKSYFLKINRESMNSKQVSESFQLLYSLNEFEKIADIISGNLATRAERWSLKEYDFSEQGKTYRVQVVVQGAGKTTL